RPGDNTPRIIGETGALSHAGPGDRDPSLRGHQQGNGLWCRAVLENNAVVVARWQAHLLDAEVRARILMGRHGLPAASLLGHGPGWMVLEDLEEGMWRRASATELTEPVVLGGLGTWLAGLHSIRLDAKAATEIGRSALSSLLDAEMVQLAATRLPGHLAARLREIVARSSDVLSVGEPVLCLGSLDPGAVWILGLGGTVMPGELGLCCAGVGEEDLATVAEVLDANQMAHLRRGYDRALGPGHGVDDHRLQAAQRLRRVARIVAAVIAGQELDPVELEELAVLCG
ncbi:hypothetical protein ACTQ49_14825, partial [Luteococcus sp. Sow4_B9]|uniref:hypothetical protein n=1 Tax=Luteococcus sp. Sow4_B9 TaxID=3438792 RepID=UPI003F962171